MTEREVCKHGHAGWMSRRYQWGARRRRYYWTRHCIECARIWTHEQAPRRFSGGAHYSCGVGSSNRRVTLSIYSEAVRICQVLAP